MRLKGAPIETIKMDVEIDATDQLKKPMALQLRWAFIRNYQHSKCWFIPKKTLAITNTVRSALGTVEVLPPIWPFTLLVWGLKRVVPVRLTDLSITEEAFDQALNPTRAKVSLGLRVLSYNDLTITDPGYHIFLTHQIAKEVFATIGSVGNLGAVVGSDVKLF